MKPKSSAPAKKLADRPLGNPASPYIFADEAARYLRFGTVQLFREWVWRYGVPHKKRGRTMLFTKAELDAFMDQLANA